MVWLLRRGGSFSVMSRWSSSLIRCLVRRISTQDLAGVSRTQKSYKGFERSGVSVRWTQVEGSSYGLIDSIALWLLVWVCSAMPNISAKGLLKNTTQQTTLFALSNLWMMRKRCKRSTKQTYNQVRFPFTVAFPVSSSTVTTLRSLLPWMHAATAQVRGAATYRAPGR